MQDSPPWPQTPLCWSHDGCYFVVWWDHVIGDSARPLRWQSGLAFSGQWSQGKGPNSWTQSGIVWSFQEFVHNVAQKAMEAQKSQPQRNYESGMLLTRTKAYCIHNNIKLKDTINFPPASGISSLSFVSWGNSQFYDNPTSSFFSGDPLSKLPSFDIRAVTTANLQWVGCSHFPTET